MKETSPVESHLKTLIEKPLMGRKRLNNTNVEKRNVKKNALESRSELADRVSSDLPSNLLLMWKSALGGCSAALLFVCVFPINSRGFC